MSYQIKAVLVIVIVAVVSFFVAQAVIPEKSEVMQKEAGEPAREKQTAAKAPVIAHDEDVPVVVVDAPAPKTEAAPTAAAVVTVSATKAPLPDTKAKLPDTKAPAAADTKKAALFSEPQKVAMPEPRAKLPDTKAAANTKAAAVPEVKKDTVARKPPPAQAAGAMPYKIEKAAVCGSIVNRAPEGISNRFSKNTKHIYYYTHITGARDSTTIIHRWYYNGKLIQTSYLPVNSSYWRTQSKRNLADEEASGEWRVEAVEPKSGKVIESAAFVIE
jgi:hypothetical protein